MARRLPRNGGRRPLLVRNGPERMAQDLLLEAIRNGSPIRHACLYSGLAERSVARWLSRGEAEHNRQGDLIDAGNDHPTPDAMEEPYWLFWQGVVQARADAAVKALGYLDTAAQGGFVTKVKEKTWYEDGSEVTEKETSYAPPEWRAAAWLLDRSFRGDFGPNAQEITLSGLPGASAGEGQAVDGDVGVLAARLAAIVAARRQEALEIEAGDDGDVLDADLVEEGPAL